MKKLKSIYLLLLSVLVIGAFASCAGSTDDDDGKPDAFKGEAYFTVQVAVLVIPKPRLVQQVLKEGKTVMVEKRLLKTNIR